jgi:hypothetical protein
MPLPSVEPMPPVPALLRFSEPDEAQDASYLAASERMASLRRRVSAAISFPLCSHEGITRLGDSAHVKKT